jgi:hypothetical protein
METVIPENSGDFSMIVPSAAGAATVAVSTAFVDLKTMKHCRSMCMHASSGSQTERVFLRLSLMRKTFLLKMLLTV